MANRPVFRVNNRLPYVQEIDVNFKFYSGFAIEQKQRCISSLHEAYLQKHQDDADKILEVSSKSTIPLGQQLSAFSLKLTLSDGKRVAVENVFQAGKCFENKNQYTDLLNVSPSEAKKDERLRTSGEVIGFMLEGKSFPILPQTFFYDWIYINALVQNPVLSSQLIQYTAFTDIEFNPQRSINCQARSAALYVSLYKCHLLDIALVDSEKFMKMVYTQDAHASRYARIESTQISMFDQL